MNIPDLQETKQIRTMNIPDLQENEQIMLLKKYLIYMYGIPNCTKTVHKRCVSYDN